MKTFSYVSENVNDFQNPGIFPEKLVSPKVKTTATSSFLKNISQTEFFLSPQEENWASITFEVIRRKPK